jgi:hypothetical protein
MIRGSLVLSILGAFVTAVPSLAGAWTGKEVTREGVVQVTNPAKPSEGSIAITPHELWRAGGDDDEDVLFGVLGSVDIDAQGDVYALDVQLSQVHVFSRDGQLLRTIGREGEGPGEFRRASQMFLTPDGNVAVLQRMPGKLVLLTPDGKPAGDFHGPEGSDGGTISYSEGGVAGDSYVLGTSEFAQRDGKLSLTRALVVLDLSGKAGATIYTETHTRDMASMMSVDEKETRGLLWAAGPDGRVYTSENFDGYEIKCFSPDGKLVRVIEREYTHRTRNKQEMEDNKPRIMMRREGGRAVQPEAKASPTDRDVLRLIPRPDGTLWVLSSRGANDQPAGTLVTLDVFDAAGHYVREVALRVPADFKQDEFHLIGDRLVVVKSLRSAREAMFAQMGDEKSTEDGIEPEPVSLVCYRLEPQPTAKR